MEKEKKILNCLVCSKKLKESTTTNKGKISLCKCGAEIYVPFEVKK